EVVALSSESEDNYVVLGLIAMIDPPREESKAAVEDAKKAGIRTIMITGDHKVTATAIAREIGIFEEGDLAVTGQELEAMSEEELEEKLPKISVYARVSPEHKIRIVNAWQKRGNIVAMTGDGVNDAPALKKADIGVAMGITGTEVSKDAAAMILADDNFATIIKAVANGRNVYRNIKNAIQFLLSGNMAGILSVVYTSLAGLPVPFAPVHLLFINLLTDSLPAIAIGMEPAEKGLLEEAPRDPKEGIMTKEFMRNIMVQGGLIAVATMTAFHIGLKEGDAKTASTMAFATLTMARLFHGFNCRSRRSIFSLGFMSNPYSVMAFAAGMVLIGLVLCVPVLWGLFSVAPLTGRLIASCLGLAVLPTVLIQGFKMIRN
ncbi:MAG: cation-translocating P-type ATPase, partial [Acetivibrio ethanolgignens]